MALIHLSLTLSSWCAMYMLFHVSADVVHVHVQGTGVCTCTILMSCIVVHNQIHVPS